MTQIKNILAAFLLLVMKEEDAFWVLCTICDQLVPDYYNQEMLGSMVDKELFEELVEYYLPDITRHLQKFKLPVSLISLPWLLCLFIGTVPLTVSVVTSPVIHFLSQQSVRILDCFFYLGRNFLLQLGMITDVRSFHDS